MERKGCLFIVSAPSGAGKTSLVTTLIDKLGHEYNLKRPITYTTKQPRAGEVPGKDYHYLTHDEFHKRVAQGYFLEWSGAYGHAYGSPRYILDLLDQGTSALLILDRDGARAVYDQYPQAILIWLYVDSYHELANRLARRGSETKDQMFKRLSLAQQEIEQEMMEPFFEYHVKNDAFQKALSVLESIVIYHVKNSGFFEVSDTREKKLKNMYKKC